MMMKNDLRKREEHPMLTEMQGLFHFGTTTYLVELRNTSSSEFYRIPCNIVGGVN